MPSHSRGMSSSPVHQTAPSWSCVSWGMAGCWTRPVISHMCWAMNTVLHGLERRGAEEDDASLQPGVDVAGAAVVHSGGGRGKPLPGHAACWQLWCG